MPLVGIIKYIINILIIMSTKFIFKSATCLFKEFKIPSIILSRYIIGITGAKIFIIDPISLLLYTKNPISFENVINIPDAKIDIIKVILNTLDIIKLTILFLLSECASAISG